MKVTALSADPLGLKTDVLVIGCDEEALADHPIIGEIDKTLSGQLRRAIRDERFRAKANQVLSFATYDRLPAARLALLGLGPRAGTNGGQLRHLGARAARLANSVSATKVTLLPPHHPGGAPETDQTEGIQRLAEGLRLGLYRFDKYLSEEKRTPRTLTEAEILLPASIDASTALIRAERTAAAVALARDFVNEPAGHMTPIRLADLASDLARQHGLAITVLGPDDCRRLGMGLYLAVAQGSVQEPRFIHLSWKPAAARKRVVVIGKGVTFDSGGLSLKPSDSMLDMKADMAGAAAVISAMTAIATEGIPIEVHALAACTENMISGSAYKLGDVLRSKNGKTIEINNTDAEGRLTLADAISYGAELRPDLIIDFATLTGACVVALGPHIAGVMSNDEAQARSWLSAARAAGEDMWPLPLPDRLLEQLKSEIADMKNTGERWGGALTAGLFLREFVGAVPWIHVDLAGPSTADKEYGATTKGGTGFAVATLLEFLRRQASA